MLYNSLKLLHIISATLLVMGIVVSFRLWKTNKETLTFSQHIQTQTALVIIPLSLFQLASGFTMISLKHYAMSEFWIKQSVIGFIVLIGSWIAILLLNKFRRIQGMMFGVSIITILYMIFLMANRI